MIRINFNGYKRLLDTSCNVDGDVVAFVGPDESGKTTVLEGLAWLSMGGPLEAGKANRTVDPQLDGPVVSAVFALEDRDIEALSEVEMESAPKTVKFARHQDGATTLSFNPPLTRPSALREAVLKALSDHDLRPRLGEATAVSHESVVELAESGREWTDRDVRIVDTLIESFGDLPLSSALAQWKSQMEQPAPAEAAGEMIMPLLPKFVLFTPKDRALRFEYSLRRRSSGNRIEESADVQKPDGGLANLLALADTTIGEFSDLVAKKVPERVETHARISSGRINERIAHLWTQSPLEVHLVVSDTTLRVFIVEGNDTARITDRSDGLKIFMALVAFLARHASDPPPVLLIDEADIHLHYDAQADLINFLTDLPCQTLYTTHSPGCLPLDLGTGIRVVEPVVGSATSILKNNFWDSQNPGFQPLLFAMGAGAAAFSELRAAVFAEGPSDMMLLPSLIREATGVRNLGYQVVPGLATLRPEQLGGAGHTAVRVAYLFDGDAGGRQKSKQLIHAGVPRHLILQLPCEWATEDLIAPDVYLRAVNGILEDAGSDRRVGREDVLDPPDRAKGTIARAVTQALGETAPSKVAVAGRLLREGDIELSEGAAESLADLDSKLARILEIRR